MVDSLLAAKADSFRFFVETVSQSMQAQQHIAMYGITVLVVIFAALLAVNWYTNYRQYKAALTQATEAMRKELHQAVEARVKEETARVQKTVTAELQARIGTLAVMAAGQSAVLAGSLKSWQAAAVGFAATIQICAAMGMDAMMRPAVESLLACLNECRWLEEDTRAKVRECLNSIPAILDKEKKAIADRLAALPEKEPPKPPVPTG